MEAKNYGKVGDLKEMLPTLKPEGRAGVSWAQWWARLLYMQTEMWMSMEFGALQKMKGTYSVTLNYEVQGLGVGVKNKAGGGR